MARFCPQCNMVMCEEEARSGTCPVCKAALPWATPAPPPPPSTPASSRSHSLLWTVVVGIVIYIGVLAFLYYRDPEDTEAEEEKSVNRQDAKTAKERRDS